MRKKIEELRNRDEGFTLVELLAVIVILGIIVAIAIPAVGSVIDKANSGATTSEQALVADAARLYITTDESADVVWTPATGDGSAKIDVEDLYTGGFLEKRDGDELVGDVIVKRTTVKTEGDSNIYTYKYDASEVEKKK